MPSGKIICISTHKSHKHNHDTENAEKSQGDGCHAFLEDAYSNFNGLARLVLFSHGEITT